MNQSIWIALSIAVVVLLLIVIWSIRRHRDPELHIESDSPIDELMPSLAGLTLGTAVRRQLGRGARERRLLRRR